MAGPRAAVFTGILLLGAAWPAAAIDNDWDTDAEIDSNTSAEARKAAERFKDRLKQREKLKQENPQVDERELESALKDPAIQAENARIVEGAGDLADLMAEYLEEKGQAGEEAIWTVAEEKGHPNIRKMYREYLRRVYFHGTAKDANAAMGIAWMRRNLETPGGWRYFPTAHVGPPPIPGAAGVYETGPQHITIKDDGAIVVFSHEMWHHIDNVIGGIDGAIAFNAGGVEPLAYGLMGSELGGG
jgi:hypothetical protein